MEDIPCSELLFVLLREKGIHIWDGFSYFLTTAYSKDDITQLIDAVVTSAYELVTADFFTPESKNAAPAIGPNSSLKMLNTPPVPGARFGRDEAGNPAWFVVDAQHDGEYVKMDL